MRLLAKMTMASATITTTTIPGAKSVMLREPLLAELVEDDEVVRVVEIELVEFVIVVASTVRSPF